MEIKKLFSSYDERKKFFQEILVNGLLNPEINFREKTVQEKEGLVNFMSSLCKVINFMINDVITKKLPKVEIDYIIKKNQGLIIHDYYENIIDPLRKVFSRIQLSDCGYQLSYPTNEYHNYTSESQDFLKNCFLNKDNFLERIIKNSLRQKINITETEFLFEKNVLPMFIHDGSQTHKENNLGLWMNSWLKGSQSKREIDHDLVGVGVLIIPFSQCGNHGYIDSDEGPIKDFFEKKGIIHATKEEVRGFLQSVSMEELKLLYEKNLFYYALSPTHEHGEVIVFRNKNLINNDWTLDKTSRKHIKDNISVRGVGIFYRKKN